MKKYLCAALAGLMLCAMAGCMPDDNVQYVQPNTESAQPTETAEPQEDPAETETWPTTPNDMDSHIGTWHTTIDLEPWLKERFSNFRILPFFSDDAISAELFLELTEDGSYLRYVSPRMKTELLDRIYNALKTATYRYLNDYLTQNGAETSPEEFLASYELTMDSFIETRIIKESFDEFNAELLGMLEKTCHYRIVNGKLYSWYDGERSTAYYETFTLTELTLTIEGNNAGEDPLGLYPLQFAREASD